MAQVHATATYSIPTCWTAWPLQYGHVLNSRIHDANWCFYIKVCKCWLHQRSDIALVRGSNQPHFTGAVAEQVVQHPSRLASKSTHTCIPVH